MSFALTYKLGQLCDVLSKTRLQVSSLVLMNNVDLSQLVQKLLYCRIELCSLLLVSHVAQLANGIAHSLCIVLVMQSLLLVLTDSLYWWFVICHLYVLFLYSLLMFVVPSRVELLFREWKSLVLTDRRRDHCLFAGAKLLLLFESCKFFCENFR